MSTKFFKPPKLKLLAQHHPRHIYEVVLVRLSYLPLRAISSRPNLILILSCHNNTPPPTSSDQNSPRMPNVCCGFLMGFSSCFNGELLFSVIFFCGEFPVCALDCESIPVMCFCICFFLWTYKTFPHNE